jgi:hypothetical protein
MMPIDPWFRSFKRLKGMRRQIELASKSGCEFHVQVAEHYKKSYYDVKVYENMRSAEDYFYNRTTIKPRGRKRFIKIDAGVVTVIREQLGEKIENRNE